MIRKKTIGKLLRKVYGSNVFIAYSGRNRVWYMTSSRGCSEYPCNARTYYNLAKRAGYWYPSYNLFYGNGRMIM